MSIPPHWVTLRSPELSAAVDPLGAQLSVLRDREGRDLLWNGDPSIWAGRAPLLFPIVGELAHGRYRLGSSEYPLSRHGFARRSEFSPVDASDRHVLMRLKADAASLTIYPFDFALDVEFRIVAQSLMMTSWVRNLGNSPMPASIGYHPALRWPLPFGQSRADHRIDFACDEPSPVRRLGADGLLTAAAQPTPVVERRLALHDQLFRNDAIIFDAVRSRSVMYGATAGPRLEISFPDAPYLGVWTKPGAPFICIEPWRGLADPHGFEGDFSTKPGIFIVPPGGSEKMTMGIALR